MDANVFIKDAKVEGNKITSMTFRGDWDLEVGGGAPITKYVFADGALVVDEEVEDDPFISIVPKVTVSAGVAFIATINFLADAYIVRTKGTSTYFASSYELGYPVGQKILAGQSVSYEFNFNGVSSDGYISIILLTSNALVKVYKLSRHYLESLI